jgi:tRNA pseudouridine55 synthase
MALHHVSFELNMQENGQLVRLYEEGSSFLGIFQIDTEAALLKPVKVFSAVAD